MTRTLEQMSAIDPSTRRDDRAKAAAPYLHPRLSSVEHTGDTEEFPKAADLTDDQLAAGAKPTVVKSLAWLLASAR